MTKSTEDQKFEQLVQKIAPQSRILRTWQLEGGVSAQVTAVEIERPDGQTQKIIVRRHGDADLKRNPQVAAGEFRLLQILQSQGLAAPAPYHLDQSGEIFSTPYVVVEYVEGEPEFAPTNIADCLLQMATQLARIHRVDGSKLDLSFLPELGKGFRQRPAKLDESLDEGRIRDALESAWPIAHLNGPVLLHGDFWPGNLLWRNGQLGAIIDWEDAKLGDPLADLANGRLEILWAFGVEAMNEFTNRYQSMTTIDFTNLPYWDLCAALRPASKMSEWGLDEATVKKMREGHRWFIGQAFEKLSV